MINVGPGCMPSYPIICVGGRSGYICMSRLLTSIS
jgi:hypothetical protein